MIRTAHAPHLKSSTSEPVCVLGIITLHVRMRDCRVRIDFGVVRNLAVSVLLGKTFIDRFVKSIFPAEMKVAPYNSKPVPILILTMQKTKDEQ